MSPLTICCAAAPAAVTAATGRAAALRLASRPGLALRTRSRAAAPATYPLPACRSLSHLQRPARSTFKTPAPYTATTTTSVGRRASYHSYDHPAPEGPFGEVESTILAAAYRRVPEHGFTAEALALGARDAGYLDISPSVLPDGPFGLIRWHLSTQREALAARAQLLFSRDGAEDSPPPCSPAERAELLVWERLLGNQEVIGRWQEALAIMAQPSHVPASLRELALLADEVWFLAGDVSVDPSWYTKRASVSAIYAAAELFMTDDRSPGFRDTRAFLRRRFAEAGGLGGAAASLGQWLSFSAGAGLNVLRSKGLPI